MRIFHQSRLTSRPCTTFGLYTRPAVLVLEVSGFSSGLEPELKSVVACWPGLVATLPSRVSWRKLAGTFSAWQRAATAALVAAVPKEVSHGSVNASRLLTVPPYRSSTVGARKPVP
ncbi:hypothetical protein G6F32_015217 [Rhizopus arrhizus]|nr:hypothetical protein G6F32_015217 [Rhizopus arrhizus]